MNQSTQLQKVNNGGPVSTGMDLLKEAPHQSRALATTVVALDRENLTFFANMIKGADLVPQVKGVTPEISFNRVMAKIVAGTSYGFDPMLSQTAFHVMYDQLALSAQGHEILFRRSGEYDTRIVQLDDEGCKVKVLKNIEGVWKVIGEVEFTKAMAQKAGLLVNKMYDKYGPDMYFARVMIRVVKRFNPGCLQPTMILGNHFARESQPGYGIQAPATTEALPPAPVAAEEQHPNATPHEDPTYDGAEEILSDEEIDGEVTEYAEPIEVAIDDSDIDPEESRHADLLLAAKDLYVSLDKEKRKNVDKWLGNRTFSTLTIAELTEFLDTF